VHQNRVRASKQAAENRLRRKREALIVAHMETARTIARQVWHRFTKAGQGGYASPIALEDMESCAYIGLVEAAGRWDPSRGEFAPYCYLRVRGAVIDAHRRQTYLEIQHDSIDQWLEDETNQETHNGNGGVRLVARYLRDPRALPDEVAGAGERKRLVGEAIERILSDEERDVMREALAGAGVADIGARRGRSAAWARSKVNAARERLSAAVQARAA